MRYSKIPMLNSGFRREVDEKPALLGYYSQSSANFSPTFRVILLVIFSKLKKTHRFPFEDGADRLSRNVDKELALLAE